jgi:hypothetical protein
MGAGRDRDGDQGEHGGERRARDPSVASHVGASVSGSGMHGGYAGPVRVAAA